VDAFDVVGQGCMIFEALATSLLFAFLPVSVDAFGVV
jgi:hypothetical protein